MSLALVAPALVTAVPAAAAKPTTPASVTSVTARPGPGVGQVTLSWKSSGQNTTGFALQTALNSFSTTTSLTPGSGRRARLTVFGGGARSTILSATRVHSLGAGVASGNALFFRFYALNAKGTGTTVRAYPYLQTMLPRPSGPKAKGTSVRVASFNVRTSRATQDERSWLRRAPDVAAEIISHKPGVVAIQELGPGRADGRTGTIGGTTRQTDSLEAALNKAGGKRYQLVRTTPYVAPEQATATQGARILYDSSRYTLLTRCPEKTGKRSYSGSCTIILPMLSSDSESDRRRGAMAEFRDRSTGKRFWFVSVHLDARHSSTVATERKYDALRRAQAEAIIPRVARFNRDHAALVVGGDFNSWQNSKVANSAHDRLIALGFYDTSSAVHRVNFSYSTYTAFKATMPAASQRVGVRLDQLFVKGVTGSQRYENVMKVKDTSRPSDHNLILSDVVL